MPIPTKAELASAIEAAAKEAIQSLFSQHPGRFYYCSLITTGEGLPPFLSAWSEEALDVAVKDEDNPATAREELRWSYADSPYCDFGGEYFEPVRKLFEQRPEINIEMSDEEWNAELSVRLSAMEHATTSLDAQGLFGAGEARSRIVINVEIMPPDHTNTERAIRLNPREALLKWLEEAAE